MIDYKYFTFAAAPRTGSTWFLGALASAGLGECSKAYAHTPWPRGTQDARLRVSMVRHPCDWLASYFTSIYPGSVIVAEVDEFKKQIPAAKNFNDFLNQYLEKMPGAVGRVFAAYEADAFIKVADLPYALDEFLESVGVKRAARINATELPPQNVSSFMSLPRFTKEQRKAVLEAEAEFVEKFEFEFI